MYNAAGQLNRDQLVQQFSPLVKRIACHLLARLPASVQLDDLIQNGMLGLLDAIARFDAGAGTQFEAYVVQRTRGAMLDGLRDNDWLPRSLRSDCRRIEAAMSRLEQEQGRTPTERELAAALDMPLAEYQKMLQEARGHQLVYLEDLVAEGDDDYLERHLVDDGADPSRLFEDDDFRQSLVKAIDGLPERERLLMALYYEQDLNLREIGEVMGVTESRVCQLHSQVVMRLRARLFSGGQLERGAARTHG